MKKKSAGTMQYSDFIQDTGSPDDIIAEHLREEE